MGSTDIVIAPPDADAIRTEYAPLVARAAALTIHSQDQHAEALTYLRDLRTAARAVTDRLEPIIQAAHRAHKGMTTLRTDLLRPVEEAVALVSRALDVYERAQKKIAEDAQRQAQEAARTQEEERRLLDAIDAEAAGNAAEAAAILDEPLVTPIVTVAPATATVQGVSTRTTWSAEVTDLLALVQHVAAHPEWIALLSANMPALNGLARSQQAALAIPGVRPVSETVRAVRAA